MCQYTRFNTNIHKIAPQISVYILDIPGLSPFISIPSVTFFLMPHNRTNADWSMSDKVSPGFPTGFWNTLWFLCLYWWYSVFLLCLSMDFFLDSGFRYHIRLSTSLPTFLINIFLLDWLNILVIVSTAVLHQIAVFHFSLVQLMLW